jgi:CxxC-x17-CxxC domain-containing protein
MGNFRSGGFGGRSRGRDGDRGRDRDGDRFRGRDSRRIEMHDATCNKCGIRCQVPFRPTGDKPVLCSDCFRKNDGPSRNDFGSRSNGQSGATSEQLNQINKKLDKILWVLEDLELEIEEEEEEESDDEDEEEDLDEEASDEDEDLEEDIGKEEVLGK